MISVWFFSFVTKDLGKISGAAAKALGDMDADTLENLEVHSRNANASMKTLRSQIGNLASALSSGDLLTAELTFKDMQKEAQAASDSFKQVHGEASEAAANARQVFRDSFKGAGMDADEYLHALTTLREAQESMQISRAQEFLLTGKLGELNKARNTIAETENELSAIKLQLMQEIEPKLRIELEQKERLLEIEKERARIKTIEQKSHTSATTL